MILPPSGSKASAKPRRRHRPKPTLFGPDPLSQHYASRLEGVCDYADRLTINAYSPLAQTPGGFRAWWRDMYGSNGNLGNRRLMRPARRLSWRVRGWAQMHGVQVIDCRTGERKREIAGQNLPTDPTRTGIFCVVVNRPRHPSATCNALR